MAKFQVGERQKCLHCQTVVKFENPGTPGVEAKAFGGNEKLNFVFAQCPNCRRIIATVQRIEWQNGEYITLEERIVWPLSSGRPPAPSDAPQSMREDYDEAALVLPFSPKSSAALSRRCLQTVLRQAAHTKSRDLSAQIDEVLPSLPTHIADNLDIIRNIGNFGTHEQKSTSTGTILDVEPGEAEWNLDVLDALFDFYYVKPAVEAAKRAQLDKKLAEAGKPPLKKP